MCNDDISSCLKLLCLAYSHTILFNCLYTHVAQCLCLCDKIFHGVCIVGDVVGLVAVVFVTCSTTLLCSWSCSPGLP